MKLTIVILLISEYLAARLRLSQSADTVSPTRPHNYNEDYSKQPFNQPPQYNDPNYKPVTNPPYPPGDPNTKINTSLGGTTTHTTNSPPLQANFYYFLNDTFPYKPKINQNTFLNLVRKWDYKMVEAQFSDIWETTILKNNSTASQEGIRHYIRLYLDDFTTCDTNKDQVLDYNEFVNCCKTDRNFKGFLSPVPIQFASMKILSRDDTYYQLLFILTQSIGFKTGEVNFQQYLWLRQFVFAYRKCTEMAPFVNEVAFECVLKTSIDKNIQTRNTVSNAFRIMKYLSNIQDADKMDFIHFYLFASSLKLYSKINLKEDNNMIKKELQLALDKNILPSRFTQEIVNTFFKLIHETDKPNEGIDPITFMVLDFALRTFDYPLSKRPHRVDCSSFKTILLNPFFPRQMLERILQMPTLPLERDSYQMYNMLNTTRYHRDDDFYFRFKQVYAKNVTALPQDYEPGWLNTTVGSCNPGRGVGFNATNSTFTTGRLFRFLDVDGEGWLSFLRFGNFFQNTLIYSQLDIYHKGRVLSSKLYDEFSNWYGYPLVSHITRQRASRFSLVPPDLYLNLFDALVVVMVDDNVANKARRRDPTTLPEPDLKMLMLQCNYEYLPEPYLKDCMRLIDEERIPKFDWECSVIQGVIQTSKFWELVHDYKMIGTWDLEVRNSVFVNADTRLKQLYPSVSK